MDWTMDWDAAIKRHSEALNRIVAALFALLGLEGEAIGGTDSEPPLPGRLARAAACRIRGAPPHRHRGQGLGGEAGAVASHAQGDNHRKG